EGAAPPQGVDEAARGSLHGNRGETNRAAASAAARSAPGRTPGCTDETPRARAERTREPPLGLRGQALRRRADRPLGVAGLDPEYAERLVTRHQRRADHPRRFRL